MGVKNFCNALVMGAAVTLGSVLVKKGVDELSDPYKRAKIKKGFNNVKNKIKDTFTKEDES